MISFSLDSTRGYNGTEGGGNHYLSPPSRDKTQFGRKTLLKELSGFVTAHQM
jgi:hypothetical protein